MNREPQPQAAQPKDTAGEAIYPGKEAWKNEPDNRYTAEELCAMERNWAIEVIDPNVPEFHDGN